MDGTSIHNSKLMLPRTTIGRLRYWSFRILSHGYDFSLDLLLISSASSLQQSVSVPKRSPPFVPDFSSPSKRYVTRNSAIGKHGRRKLWVVLHLILIPTWFLTWFPTWFRLIQVQVDISTIRLPAWIRFPTWIRSPAWYQAKIKLISG